MTSCEECLKKAPISVANTCGLQDPCPLYQASHSRAFRHQAEGAVPNTVVIVLLLRPAEDVGLSKRVSKTALQERGDMRPDARIRPKICKAFQKGCSQNSFHRGCSPDRAWICLRTSAALLPLKGRPAAKVLHRCFAEVLYSDGTKALTFRVGLLVELMAQSTVETLQLRETAD